MNRKTTLAAVLTILAAAALASCRTNTQVTNSVKQLAKGITGMTAEKVAGIYEMTALSSGTAKSDNSIDLDDYVSNVLTLGSDGAYSLTVVTKPTYDKEEAEEKEYTVTGTYEIADNGIMKFYAPEADGKKKRAYIAAADEQIFYDDAKGVIVFDGSVIDMEYTRESAVDKEEKAVEAPAKETEGTEEKTEEAKD